MNRAVFKHIKSYLIKINTLLFLVFLLTISCSDKDDTVWVEKFNYYDPYISSLPVILILSDTDGNFLDSATVKSNGVAVLMGPENLSEFTLTKIVKENSKLTIYTYFNLTLSQWNDYTTFEESNNYATLTPNANDPGFYVLNGNYSKDAGLSSIIKTDINNQVFAIYIEGSKAPKFKMFSNLGTNEGELLLNPSDFSEMNAFKILSSSQGATLASFYGRTESDSKAVHSLSGLYAGNIQDYYANEGLYIPESVFKFYQVGFNFSTEDSELASSYYYGALPSSISKLDKGEFILNKDVSQYSCSSSNSSVNVINSQFTDSEGNSLNIYGENGKDHPVGKILDNIGDLYPDRIIPLDQWAKTEILAVEGISYNEYIEVVWDPDIASSPTYASMKKIYFY